VLPRPEGPWAGNRESNADSVAWKGLNESASAPFTEVAIKDAGEAEGTLQEKCRSLAMSASLFHCSG
jgi:hypothetical protein